MSKDLYVNFDSKTKILRIALNRPEVKNALNFACVRAMDAVLREHAGKARCVVFESIGNVFCAGADLKERRSMSIEDVHRWLQELNDVMDLIETYPAVTVASIQGPAFGGGVELALACDFRVASASATFQLSEVGLAIIPGAGGTYRLPKLVGLSRAMEMIVGLKKLDAACAKEWGVVMEVMASDADLRKRVDEFSLALANQAPLAVQSAKRALRDGFSAQGLERRKIELDAYEVCLQSKDRLEALAAFAEKRAAKFTGS